MFVSLRCLVLTCAQSPIPIKVSAHTKTRPSSDSEAATMYKLKGQSSNMRTGQSFVNKELVCLAGPIQ